MYALSDLTVLYEGAFNESNFNANPAALYQPVNHIMNMKGKRIRPILLLLACDMFGGDVKQALNPAFAMEVFHNFTLVHDDIMDHADIRRGIPTVHVKYGLNAGILAGDVMLAYAYKYLCSVPAHFIPHLMDAFSKTAIEIFEGQQMDMDFENRMDVTESEYLKMIEYKTSVLLACSLQLGAVLANAPVADRQLVYNFGLNLGLSFQIKDDYLDAFGEAEMVGKRIGGDILQNKKTYLFINALALSSAADKAALLNLLNEKDEEKKITEAKQIFERSGAKDKALNTANALYQKAIESLNGIAVAPEQKQYLLQMADMINNRLY